MTVTLAGLLASVAFVGGCALIHTPVKVALSTGTGPHAHQWTAKVSATGDGLADASLIITYPDGHKVDQWDCLAGQGASGSTTLGSLAKGTYRWAIYAIHVGTDVVSVFSLPSRDLTTKNLVSSGTFNVH